MTSSLILQSQPYLSFISLIKNLNIHLETPWVSPPTKMIKNAQNFMDAEFEWQVN